MYLVRIARVRRDRGAVGPALRRWFSRYAQGRRRERLVTAIPVGPYEFQLVRRH